MILKYLTHNIENEYEDENTWFDKGEVDIVRCGGV